MPLTDLIQNKKINLTQLINLVILIVAALVAVNIFRGQNRGIARIQQASNEQREKNQMLLRLGKLKERIDLYEQKYKPLDRREIINAITDLAAGSQAKVVSIKPQEKASLGRRMTSPVYDKIFFSLILEADNYLQLAKFINRLESNDLMFMIESIQVRRKQVMHSGSIAQPDKLQIDLFISKLFFKA